MQHIQKLNEANEKRALVERENQRLSAELRESLASKSDSLLTSMHETDCNKALELAESRITVLENQVRGTTLVRVAVTITSFCARFRLI